MALSRQQIREKKRQLEKVEAAKRNSQQSLAELNEAERLLEQKRSAREQMALQTGSLCVAVLSQVPEHRAGVEPLAKKAVAFIERLIDLHDASLTAINEPEPDDDEEDDEDEQDDDDALAIAS